MCDFISMSFAELWETGKSKKKKKKKNVSNGNQTSDPRFTSWRLRPIDQRMTDDKLRFKTFT